MATDQAIALDVRHAAPLRHRVAFPVLTFSLFGGVVAWMVQLLTGFAVSSYICFGGRPGPHLAETPPWLGWTIGAVTVICLLIAAAAMAASISLIRRTSEEHRQESGGVMDAGEGRTRFLAIWGAFTSGVFIVAIAVNVGAWYLVPLCRP